MHYCIQPIQEKCSVVFVVVCLFVDTVIFVLFVYTKSGTKSARPEWESVEGGKENKQRPGANVRPEASWRSKSL